VPLGFGAGYGRPSSRVGRPACRSLAAVAAAALRGDRLLLWLPRWPGRLVRLGLLLRGAVRLEREQVGRGLWDLRPRLVHRVRQHLPMMPSPRSALTPAAAWPLVDRWKGTLDAGLARAASSRDSHRREGACRTVAPRPILGYMLPWLLVAAFACLAMLVATGGLRMRRYSGSHLVAHLAVRGRGIYFSRTPDGSWWRLRLRPCRSMCEDRGDWSEPPPDGGVREPRRPLGPGPIAGTFELDPPLDC
jgi:hypothetical protein